MRRSLHTCQSSCALAADVCGLTLAAGSAGNAVVLCLPDVRAVGSLARGFLEALQTATCLPHHGFHLLSYDSDPSQLCATSPGSMHQTFLAMCSCAPRLGLPSLHEHTRSMSTFPRGCRKVLVPGKADGQSCAELSHAGTRDGVGQVPAELTPHLARSLPSGKRELRGGQVVSCGCCPALLHEKQEPTGSLWECRPILRPLSCATSCRARPRPSPWGIWL